MHTGKLAFATGSARAPAGPQASKLKEAASNLRNYRSGTWALASWH